MTATPLPPGHTHAPGFSTRELNRLARFEGTPAPESFDATAVARRVAAVMEELDRFSDNEGFEWDTTGDLQRLGARDAFDVAVSLLRTAIEQP